MPSRRTILLLGTAGLAAAALSYPLVYPAYAGPTLDAEAAFQKAEAGEIILVDIRRPDEDGGGIA